MGAEPFLSAYVDAHQRVVELAVGAPDRLDRAVPGCPSWTAREVVHHVAALAEDWVAGRTEPYGEDEWTATHLARFADADLELVLDAWSSAAEQLSAVPDHPERGDPVMWAFGDLVVHEGDLRPVLAPGTLVPDDAMMIAIKSGVARWRVHLAQTGLPPLRLVVLGRRDYLLGSGHSDDATKLEASPNEAFRLLYGRRSRDQVAALSWTGDATPYLDVGLPAPFRWAEGPVHE